MNIFLYNVIDNILWLDWDPLGVRSIAPEDARDEYYSYIPEIYKLLEESPDADKLFDYLFTIEKTRMNINTGRERCSAVAKKLVEARLKLTF
jgi:hypothetical protein